MQPQTLPLLSRTFQSWSSFMGAIFSSQCSSTAPSVQPTTLGDLPEGCAAVVMSYLGPEDICHLGRLNRAFRGASWADFVWESKLPENYAVLTEKVFDGLIEGLRKREIYTRLCRVITFDGGSKRAWLDKRTSRTCLLISVKGLTVTGIDDRRYWNYIQTEESRFNTVAYVQQTWWFEIEGEVEFPFPAGTYSVFIRLQLGRTHKRFGRRLCNTEHVHGWDIKPVRFHLSTSDGQSTASKCFLTEPGKWLNYHVGDFTVLRRDSTQTTKVKFSVTQIDCTHTKGGLCLDSALIYPIEYKERLKHF